MMNQKPIRTVVLPEEFGNFVDEKLSSGAYKTDAEVVTAALLALREKDDDIRRWLTEDVAAAYDDLEAHPERAIPASDVFAALATHHAKRR